MPARQVGPWGPAVLVYSESGKLLWWTLDIKDHDYSIDLSDEINFVDIPFGL
jgi:hypothetical protein